MDPGARFSLEGAEPVKELHAYAAGQEPGKAITLCGLAVADVRPDCFCLLDPEEPEYGGRVVRTVCAECASKLPKAAVHVPPEAP